MNEEEISKAVQDKFHQTAEKVKSAYVTLMNKVVKIVLFPNPSLLYKKIIVYPNHVNGNHWTVTFVFNPASIVETVDTDDKVASSSLITPACWYHYDPQSMNGSPKVKSGLPWFLNLAYSYFKACQDFENSDGTNQLKWYSPFPMIHEEPRMFDGLVFPSRMIGHSNFPKMRFNTEDTESFCYQRDGHNCGIGISAATSLILQEFLGPQYVGKAYHKFFIDAFEDPDPNEPNTYRFPKCNISSFRDKIDIGKKDYFQVLREELFLLYDRMAEYQHVILPKRQFGEACLRNEVYEAFKKEMQTPKAETTKPTPIEEPKPTPIEQSQIDAARSLAKMSNEVLSPPSSGTLPTITQEQAPSTTDGKRSPSQANLSDPLEKPIPKKKKERE